MQWSMSFVSLWTVSPVQGPFDIGPTRTLAVVETLKINCPHLHEIGLPRSTFGQSPHCGTWNADCGIRKTDMRCETCDVGSKMDTKDVRSISHLISHIH